MVTVLSLTEALDDWQDQPPPRAHNLGRGTYLSNSAGIIPKKPEKKKVASTINEAEDEEESI